MHLVLRHDEWLVGTFLKYLLIRDMGVGPRRFVTS